MKMFKKFLDNIKLFIKFDRVNFLFLLIIVLSCLIIIRLFKLQILDHSFYAALASDQHEIYLQLIPQRGEIVLQDKYSKDNYYPLATNRDYNFLYSIPKLIIDPQKTADKLAEILSINDEEKKKILEKLSKKDDPYEPILHKVSDELAEKIKAENLEGIIFVPESWRYYPQGNLGSQILGFVGFDNEVKKGMYGLEGYFNEELSGKIGLLQTERDVAGRWIALTEKKLEKAQDGSDIVLTIDRVVEYYVCDLLNKTAEKHEAEGGSVIIMNPETGALIAMCSYPDFDPNNYSSVTDISVYNNPAIFSEYEPGSIFKPITMAAALDLDLVTPNSTYVDTGFVKLEDFTIMNFDEKAYGLQTMTQILENSLNLGAIYVAGKVGQENFKKYVVDFGFGEKTGIELNSESDGNIRSLDKKPFIYTATASYGQGITVTPIQMVTAFGAIANGGKLMKTYIVDKIIRANGEIISTSPRVVRQVISSRTATLLSGMLVSVVNQGHAKKAKIEGYHIAGKTGTAQVASSVRAGYSGKTIHSFVGFAPVDDPVFVMLVKLDNPKDVTFAEGSALPLFTEIVRFLINYYEIPPEYTVTD